MTASNTERALRIAIAALERISDDKQTSLRWRSATSGQGGVEKPNVRLVAEEALEQLWHLGVAHG